MEKHSSNQLAGFPNWPMKSHLAFLISDTVAACLNCPSQGFSRVIK
jgi:hypothetical protein